VLGAKIESERLEDSERPPEAEAEVAFTFVEEGMTREDAADTSRLIPGAAGYLFGTVLPKILGFVAP